MDYLTDNNPLDPVGAPKARNNIVKKARASFALDLLGSDSSNDSGDESGNENANDEAKNVEGVDVEEAYWRRAPFASGYQEVYGCAQAADALGDPRAE